MIEFRNVYLQYIKEFYSLYNFNCEINSHTLFVGDFYSGTTSIMRTLTKLDKVYSGEVLIDNVNIKNIKDKCLNIAYLPEVPVLFNKNIFKNLYYPLKIRKINKNTAKTLIYSVFEELQKSTNCLEKAKNLYLNNNFINNYLLQNIDKNNNTDLINKFINLKVKKLNINEQKIIALIRAMLWKPKYVLLENFFKNLNKDYLPLATFLISKLKQTSTIIASEEQNIEIFKDFNIINLNR